MPLTPIDQDHLRAREGVDLERLGDRREDRLDLLGDDDLATPRFVEAALEALVGEPGADARGGRRAEVGGDQRLLDLVERLVVERAPW